MSWVVQGYHDRAKDNSIQKNEIKYCGLDNDMIVGMVSFMKHSISFSFKIVNRIYIDIITMKEITSEHVYLSLV